MVEYCQMSCFKTPIQNFKFEKSEPLSKITCDVIGIFIYQDGCCRMEWTVGLWRRSCEVKRLRQPQTKRSLTEKENQG